MTTTTTTRKTLLDHRFGFPVLLVDVPVRTMRGHEVVDVNANLLQGAVLAMLARKPAPLTGAEVRFIRLALGHTLSDFGGLLGVSHAAVIKWEGQGEAPTKMARGTEFLLRYLATEHVPEPVRAQALPAPSALPAFRQALTGSAEPGPSQGQELEVPGQLLEAVA